MIRTHEKKDSNEKQSLMTIQKSQAKYSYREDIVSLSPCHYEKENDIFSNINRSSNKTLNDKD